MQAIEFESIVGDRVIRLPVSDALRPGQPVRVVVMFEERPATRAPQPGKDAVLPPAPQPMTFAEDRVAALDPHPEAFGGVSVDFAPSTWDEAAWREKWGRA